VKETKHNVYAEDHFCLTQHHDRVLFLFSIITVTIHVSGLILKQSAFLWTHIMAPFMGCSGMSF
jgi:hypothetical protein